MLQTKFKSILAILLSFMMIVTMCPTEAFAEGSSSVPTHKSVIVRIEQLEKTDLAPERVTFNDGDTALDVLNKVATCQETNGFVSKINGYPDESLEGVNWMFRVNGEIPMMVDGKTGYTIADYPVKEGDYIEFYSIIYKSNMNSKYAKFEQRQYQTQANVPVKVVLKQAMNSSANLSGKTEFGIVNGGEILISEKDGKNPTIASKIYTASSKGEATLVFTEPGEYTISARNLDVVKSYNKITRPYATIIVNVPSQNQGHIDDVSAAKSALSLATEIDSENISLPIAGQNETIISWKSSDEAVINTSTGVVTRPANGQSDVDIKLTATIKKGACTESKIFDVKVKAYTDENDKKILTDILEDLQFYKISPIYGTEANVLTIFQEHVNTKTDKNVIVSLKSRDEEHIDASGKIIKWYEDIEKHTTATVKNLNTIFELTLNSSKVEKSYTVRLPYDESIVIASMKETDGKYLIGDSFKDKNTDLDNITSDLILPEQAGEKKAEISWSTDSPFIVIESKVTIDEDNNMFHAAKIITPAEDTAAVLTAKLTYRWDSGRKISYSKDFNLIIKAADQAQKELVAKELQAKIDELFPINDITYSRLEKSGYHFADDYNNNGIMFNFNIPNEKRNLRDEGILMDWTSSNTDVFSFEETYNSNLDKHYKSFLADVVRPNIGEDAASSDLTITLEKDGVKKSVVYTIKVAPLTEQEIDKEVALLEKIKTEFWNGIKNTNTDKNSVEADLEDFEEIYESSDNQLVWVRSLRDTKGLGFTVDENGELSEQISHKFKFSEPNLINAFNFKITSKPSVDKEIRLTTFLTSNLLGKYANIYTDNAKLNKLYKHEVNFDMTLKSEKTSGGNKDENISYAIKTAPSKIVYNVGEEFDASGLVIEKTVKVEGKSDIVTEIDYASNKDAFTFAPALGEKLTVSVTEINISYASNNFKQAITVNEIESPQEKLEKYLNANYTDKAVYSNDGSISFDNITKEQLMIKTEKSWGSDYKSIWTSSNEEVIKNPPSSSYSFVEVIRGEEDKNVTLTVTLTDKKDESITASKSYDLVIKKISEEEKTAELANIDILLNKIKLSDDIDISDVKGNFEIEEDYSNYEEYDEFKYDYEYEWKSSDSTFASVDGSRYPDYDVIVNRPSADQGLQNVDLTFTVTSEKIPSVSKSRIFKIVIKPISEEEINQYKADMQKIKDEFLAEFIGDNESADNVSKKLKKLQSASIVGDVIKWNTSKYRVKDDDYKITIGNSSNTDYVNTSGSSYGSTYSIKKRPSAEEGNQTISIAVRIESQKYEALIEAIDMTVEITIKAEESTNSYLDDKATEYIGQKTQAKVYDDFENDLWVQYDFRSMKSGDTANLYPIRVEEAVTDAINNNVNRPNFNFEIISGDSISLSTENSTDKTIVTAEKPGVSVVKVTYDAFDHAAGKHFDALSLVNTAYVVYEVDGNEDITISSGISQRSYDTIYYAEGDTVDYTFTPQIVGADSFRVTLNGQTVAKNSDASFTLPLENRSNIIGIIATKGSSSKSLYKVVDARKIIIDVNNNTRPGQEVGVNDEINISFKGIVMPVYKLATIYNPCMTAWGGKSTRTVYDLAGKTYEGPCGQWDLATKNSFNVKFTKEGQANFTNGHIYTEWWGSKLGADKGKEGQGEPNLNAPILKGDFSILPDFSVNVEKEIVISVTSVSFEDSELEIEVIDSRGVQLQAKVEPIAARNKNVSYTSSNIGVAKVDAKGKVTPVSVGQAIIRVTTEDGSKTAECTVNVVAEKPATAEKRTALAKEIKDAKVIAKDGMEALWNSLQSEIVNAEKVFSAEASLKKEIDDAKLSLIRKVNVYKEAIQFNYTLVQEDVKNGRKITIKFPNMNLDNISDKAESLKMIFSSNIAGMETIESAEFKDDKELLREFSFVVAKEATGDFQLSDGYVYSKVWSGPTPQFGSYVEKELFKGSMPTIAFTIKDTSVKQRSVNIHFTAIGYDKTSNQHYYIIPRQELTVNNGTTVEYGRENADENHMVGGNNHGVKADQITPLDAILAMHKIKYGENFTKETSDNYITNGSYLMKIFGENGSISYMVNDRAPVGDKTDGYGVNEYILSDGDDLVYFFYGSPYWADYFSYFDKKEIEVKEAEEFEIQLKAYYPMDQISGKAGNPTKEIRTEIDLSSVELKLIDAKTNKVSDTVVAITDENGRATMKFDKAGEYIVSALTTTDAMMKDAPVTLPYCKVIVKKEAPKPQPENMVTLSIDKNTIGKGYVVSTEKIEFQAGDSVWTLVKRVLDERHISVKIDDNNKYNSVYITSIDGDKEFGHGKGSGWMYKVNGIFPNFGVDKYILKKGDVIEVKYTTNYGVDIGGAYVLSDDSDKNEDNLTKRTEDEKTIKTKMKTKVNEDVYGKAVATLDSDIVEKAIDQAFIKSTDKDEKSKEVELLVETKESTKTVETVISSKVAKKIAEKADSVLIKLPFADVKLSKETLEKITKDNSKDVKLIVSKAEVKAEKFQEKEKNNYDEKIGDRPVYDFTLSSGNENISEFDNAIKISIKYKLKDGEIPSHLLVYYVDKNGNLEIVKKSSYDEKTATMYFNASHFSNYAIGYENSTFGDIENNWAAKDIEFLSIRNIIKGQTEGIYNPDGEITRAEFVQVLANIAGVKETDEESSFTDIGANDWYKSAATWAEKMEISTGSTNIEGNLVFNPNEKISRQDMAVMLVRYMEKVEDSSFVEISECKTFEDCEKISEYAKTAVKTLQTAEIINGIKSNEKYSFNPKANASRAEVAKLIRSFIEQFK